MILVFKFHEVIFFFLIVEEWLNQIKILNTYVNELLFLTAKILNKSSLGCPSNTKQYPKQSNKVALIHFNTNINKVLGFVMVTSINIFKKEKD